MSALRRNAGFPAGRFRDIRVSCSSSGVPGLADRWEQEVGKPPNLPTRMSALRHDRQRRARPEFFPPAATLLNPNSEMDLGSTGDQPVPSGHWPDGTGSGTFLQQRPKLFPAFPSARLVAARPRQVACATPSGCARAHEPMLDGLVVVEKCDQLENVTLAEREAAGGLFFVAAGRRHRG